MQMYELLDFTHFHQFLSILSNSCIKTNQSYLLNRCHDIMTQDDIQNKISLEILIHYRKGHG